MHEAVVILGWPTLHEIKQELASFSDPASALAVEMIPQKWFGTAPKLISTNPSILESYVFMEHLKPSLGFFDLA